MRSITRVVRLGSGFALAVAAACAVAQSVDATRVQTLSGWVQGSVTADGAALRWLGVPYAAPPVGALRWRAPQPAAAWSTTLPADHFGSPCTQIGGPYGPPPAGKNWGVDNLGTFGKPVGSEDCLTLNLWRPSGTETRLPVLVFIHGGSNIVGWSGDPIYDGAHLAAAAHALVVTVNYRLGLMGWFTHASLLGTGAYDDSGNFAILDLIAALHFVHDNAAAFGGDPGNVTLMGQSAGAIDVYALVASPLARGLVHKAIPLSGLIGGGNQRDQALEYGDRIVAALAVQDGLAADAQAAQRLLAGKDRAWIAQYLRGRSAAQIMRLPYDQPDLRKKAAGGWNDGQVVAVDARAAFEQGQLAPIPMMIGTTRDEAKLLAGVYRISPAEMFNLMLHSDPDARPTVRTSDIIAPYMLPSLGSWLYDHYTAAITWALKRGVNQSIAAVAAHDPQVWVYRFDWDRAPEPWHTVYGAAHGIDLPFVFGNFSTGFFAMDFSRANRPGREALSQLMMQSIGAFMRTGDPNTPQLPLRWQQWGGAGKSHAQMIFDASDELPQLTIE